MVRQTEYLIYEMCIRDRDGTYKGSLRVNGDYDVAKVASVFGGGGHVKAATL